MKKSLKIRIARMKKHFLGRVFLRLAGEERGAVMMEYILVCSFIAVAATVAMAAFGKGIVNGFNVIGLGLLADHSGATNALEEARQTLAEDIDNAQQYADSTHK